MEITHDFIAHTDILAEQMNQNFLDVKTWANNLGASQSYTPAWTTNGVAPSIGNGSISGSFIELNKKISFSVAIAMGSTTSYGSGTYFISLPKTPTLSNRVFFLTCRVVRPGVSDRIYTSFMDSGVSVFYMGATPTMTNADYALFSAASPLTWQNGDLYFASGEYIIA